MKVSKQPDGASIIRWLDNRTIEITWEGQISHAMVDQVLKDFRSMTHERVPRYALFDAGPATGFSPNARASATRFLTEFKVRGGREVVAIVNSISLRMLGQALTFATGLPLKMFATREQALSYLVSKLRED